MRRSSVQSVISMRNGRPETFVSVNNDNENKNIIGNNSKTKCDRCDAPSKYIGQYTSDVSDKCDKVFGKISYS